MSVPLAVRMSPGTDTYIEGFVINEEVERLRHSATSSLLTRRDVIVVATVSAIYGLGTPQEYVDRMERLRVGDVRDRDQLLRSLVDIQYARNDPGGHPGHVQVRGDTVEIFPMYEGTPCASSSSATRSRHSRRCIR